jgi:hypothetical protein
VKSAEGVGFEPTRVVSPAGFQGLESLPNEMQEWQAFSSLADCNTLHPVSREFGRLWDRGLRPAPRDSKASGARDGVAAPSDLVLQIGLLLQRLNQGATAKVSPVDSSKTATN